MSSLIDLVNDETLRYIVEQSSSYAECLYKIGYKSHGTRSKSKLQTRINRLNIDTSHFTSGQSIVHTKEDVFIENSACCRSVVKRWFAKEPIEYKCSICSQEPFWNGLPMTLILDHINGKNNDNRLNNLRWVCPNCNSQLPTSNGKNKKQKPKVNKVVHDYRCKNCGCKVSTGAKICRSCAAKRDRNIKKPPVLELVQLIINIGFTKAGEKYGVSRHTLKKWCKNYYHIPSNAEDLAVWYQQQNFDEFQ